MVFNQELKIISRLLFVCFTIYGLRVFFTSTTFLKDYMIVFFSLLHQINIGTLVSRFLYSSVVSFCVFHKLTLNIKKSNYVIFRPHQKKLNYQPQIHIFDNENNKKVSLERKNFIKYLGLLIEENLSWKTHINSAATKISKTIGLIARLRHIVPTYTLLNIYQSLIVPYITYGLISWGNACKTFLDQILVLQKRALRLIYFAETNDHAIPLFVKAKILPIQFLYYESVCNRMLI